MAYGAHLLSETRPMINLSSGNERYGGRFRYLGRRAISPTQTLHAAGIWIFSTTSTHEFSIAIGSNGSI